MTLARRPRSSRTALWGVAILILGSGLRPGTAVDHAEAAVDADASMIVLGIDGMDPKLLTQFMDAGLMPNFVRLREAGGFLPLGTSIPPQSPVAWSNFITGLDAGGHGIFDFIHRTPATMLPYLSTARVEGEFGKSLRCGKYDLPLSLSGPETVNLRDGLAFWEILEEHGVSATIFKVPANYPPTQFKGRSLSGMGTPDLLGTPGTFSYFTDDPEWAEKDLDGGAAYMVEMVDGVVEAALHGPLNTFVHVDPESGEEPPPALAPFTVYIDPDLATAKIELQDQEAVLKVGEWSDWLVAEFELIPFVHQLPGMGGLKPSGICRFYLMETEPNFRLYVTPLNLNPDNPAQPISTPAHYSRDLHEETGHFFYTQGMPEDTKALDQGVFDDADFVAQAGLVLEERERLLEHVLENWDRRGFLFFYFSSLDQQCHMLWHHTDPDHPSHDPERVHEFGQVLTRTYIAMDETLGRVMERIDDSTTLVVMSDHGFAPFRRAVHLNNWLMREGYLTLKSRRPTGEEEPNIFLHVDWSRTRAYAFGINMLYINVKDRERFGTVPHYQRPKLVAEIGAKLLALRDPELGAQMISRVYRREEVYEGPHVADGPDLVVGYASGYRASWQTALGQIPAELVNDNKAKWSGDHCMDHTVVPGIVLANRPMTHPDPDLTDLTVTILNEFGIQQLDVMRGRSIFSVDHAASD